MEISNIIGYILSVVIGIPAIIIAVKQNKKAKKAEEKIVELDKAMSSYKYLKDKAFSYYDNGNYDDSLDVFKKYLLNNRDENEWNDIIRKIFIKETGKYFSGLLVFNDGSLPAVSLMIQTFISAEERFLSLSPYPEIIKTLIKDYNLTFGKNRSLSEFLIHLFDKNWSEAKKILDDNKILNENNISNLFKEYVIQYLNTKLGITNERFADDIPF